MPNVSIMQGMLAAMQETVSSVHDGDISGAQADSNQVRRSTRWRKSPYLCPSWYAFYNNMNQSNCWSSFKDVNWGHYWSTLLQQETGVIVGAHCCNNVKQGHVCITLFQQYPQIPLLICYSTGCHADVNVFLFMRHEECPCNFTVLQRVYFSNLIS